MRTRPIVLSAVVALVLTASAYADAIFQLGNHGSDFTNVVVPAATSPPNTVLHGTLTGGGLSVNVEFQSPTNTLVSTGGSAGLTASGGLINDIMVIWPTFGFSTLQINPFTLPMASPIVVTVGVCTLVGTSCGPETFQDFVYQAMANGQNRLTIGTTMDEVIMGVRIFSTVGFQTLDQVRVSTSGIVPDLPTEPPPPPPPVIPEPPSMLLLGSGLLVFTQVLRRKLKLGFWTRSA